MDQQFYKQSIQAPQAPITTLPLAEPSQLTQASDMLQFQHLDYPRDSSIVDVFRRQAAACPDTVAVKDISTQITYAELDQQSEQLAWWLVQRGLKPETLVGVFAARSCQTVVAFLGILKAHLAYLPLDVNAPPARIAAILSSVPGPKIVFRGENAPPLQSDIQDIEAVYLTDVLDSVKMDTYQIHEQPLATSLAYVMFTSGSTGRPKGVMIEHRGVVRLVKQVNITSTLQAGTKIAHVANLAFDASTWEIYTAILNGGTLVCFDFMTVLDAASFSAQFKKEQVQIAKFTPSLLEQYLHEAPTLFQSLNILVSAGDRLHPRIAQQAIGLVPGRIINAYGPTENTGFSTSYEISREEVLIDRVPIGYAIGSSGAVVMDAKQHAVPDGVVGELVVVGDGLARGYLDPQHNRDRFISIAVAGESFRAYRTGDLVRRRPRDGALEFIGRMDHQVKIRGHRVELGEIEHALLENELVNNAAVVVQSDNDTDAKLVAFVTLRPDGAVAVDQHHQIAEQLHGALLTRLPSYMVPSSINVLDKMPLNQNKKVDRGALTKMEKKGHIYLKSARVEPRNEIERTLCEEFTAILGIEAGITDNFFGLGGHSLMATRVISRINRKLHCKITAFEFYQFPTPAGLSVSIMSGSNHIYHHRSHVETKGTIVLVHGIWGQGNIFLSLIPLLDPYFDVILVHDPFFGSPEGPTTISDWAKSYVDDIKGAVNLHLPVILGGYSLGGLIAFEMASIWREMFGSDPASVLLLDAGSYPTIAKSFSQRHLSEETLNHALSIFGDDQELLVRQHFAKLQLLSLQHVEQHIHYGDCLYLHTPQSRVHWWMTHCPKLTKHVLHCGHHDVLDRVMVHTVAQLMNEHYRTLIR
ncbi:hypothetical protein ZTR_11194 [Talaromyces verruculosus]|nr:hypothetical protein ZTR_11194 [Talaromyces verruculosus]